VFGCSPDKQHRCRDEELLRQQGLRHAGLRATCAPCCSTLQGRFSFYMTCTGKPPGQGHEQGGAAGHSSKPAFAQQPSSYMSLGSVSEELMAPMQLPLVLQA